MANEIEKDNPIVSSVSTQSLIQDLRQIVEQARCRVASTANTELTMMYWYIGERINREVLGNQRAEYGKQIVASVARQLQEDFGTKGFEERTIRRMMQFAQMFPDFQIVSPLVSKLSWSHFLMVMPLKDELQREFYITMAQGWHQSRPVHDRVAASRSADTTGSEILRGSQSPFRRHRRQQLPGSAIGRMIQEYETTEFL